MARTAQDIMKMIAEQDIKMVDFKIVDINGQFRHVTIPASQFNESTMTDGIGFDASNYGYAVVEKSDMVFIPIWILQSSTPTVTLPPFPLPAMPWSSTIPRTVLWTSTPETSFWLPNSI